MKSKRIQGSASAAANGFFRYKSGKNNHSKINAVQKKANKKIDTGPAELDGTSDGSISYL